jgi:hypothetical protein
MNYEQKSKSLDQAHEYQDKTRLDLLLITRSRNKSWIQLVLMRVRNNVPWLSIYILDIYSTLFAAQAIYGGGLSLKLLSLHSKLS